ncbi:MAG TPA: response regulator, partial [Candidatus Synoicihabitans sp.]|nr:response regulator [Candidatus Synoicihabitans sp.]
GAIICDSTPGAGTCFRIYLPPVEDEGVQVSPRVREPSRGRGERVLLVDDEEPVVAIAGRMLERLGYKPHVFTDARRALAELERTPQAYDLLLSDLTMSGITGIDLARRARELRPDFPIIITTGFMNARDIDTARGLGVSVFLEKPFALSALADCLQIALHPSERSGSRPPMPWAGR